MIIFDLDGTLTDITERWYQLHLAHAAQFGLTPVPRAQYVTAKQEGEAETAILRLTNPSASNGTLAEYDAARIAEIEEPQYLHYDRLQPGAVDLLKELNERDATCILVSKRRTPVHAEAQLDAWDIAQYFDGVFFTDSKKAALTETYPAGLLQKRVFVSDALEDAHTAQELGMTAIVVGYGCRSSAYFSAHGFDPISSVEELRTKLAPYT